MPSCAVHRKQTRSSLNLFQKSKIKFTILLGLKFVYKHGSRLALLQWEWQKKWKKTQLSASWIWAKSMLTKKKAKGTVGFLWREVALGLFALMKRWWSSSRLSNSSLHWIPPVGFSVFGEKLSFQEILDQVPEESYMFGTYQPSNILQSTHLSLLSTHVPLKALSHAA